jgi:hypothetical protein
MITLTKKAISLIAVMFAGMLLYSAPAAAQASRTWVSGVGDDANPCSRTAPCKTFAGAISKTAVNGEIDCLDPGGFGAVTLTKSITLDCLAVNGSILNAGTNGINIAFDSFSGADTNKQVVLRGLSIQGFGTGLAGVNITGAAGKLVIEDSYIGYNHGGQARGVVVGTSGNLQLTVRNTTIIDNSGGGLFAQPISGTATIDIDNVRFINNGAVGLGLTTASGASSIIATVTNSKFQAGGLAAASGIIAKAPTGVATIVVTSSSIAGGPLYGINANGAGALIRVGSSVITNNGTALNAVNSGKIESFGDNDVTANANAGAFTGTVPHS